MKRKSRKFGPRVTVSVTESDYDTLNALAAKDEVFVSWVVRRAIDEYLRRHRKDIEPAIPLSEISKRASAGGTAQGR